MPQGANLQSLEMLRELQGVLWKFREACTGALDDVEAELRRTVIWLETEQDSYWKSQIRLRHEAVERAKEALRSKKIFKDASGRPQSVVEEQKVLKIATERLAEAEQKLANVRKWVRALQKEIELYKGSVGRLSHSVESLVPAAVHQLDRMMVSLEAYVNLDMPRTDSGIPSPQPAGTNFANRGEALTNAIAASPELPAVDVRKNAIELKAIKIHCPRVDPELYPALSAPTSPFIDLRQTLVCGTEMENAPSTYTLVHLVPVEPQDSGWVLFADPPGHGSWGKTPLDSLATDVGEMEKWALIFRLPVGSRISVKENAVVHVAPGGPM
jgi:hypothetical protein